MKKMCAYEQLKCTIKQISANSPYYVCNKLNYKFKRAKFKTLLAFVISQADLYTPDIGSNL